MENISDDVLQRFRQGDEAAFNSIYKQLHLSIFSFCNHLVPEDDARDITAEIFFTLWKMREQWDSIINIKAFLFISARNHCLRVLQNMKMKSEKKKQIAYLLQNEQQLIIGSEIESEIIVQLREKVELLPEYYRQIIKLSYFEGYGNQEIAEMLGISEKTVRNAKSIALKEIKAVLFNKNLQLSFFLMLLFKH
jgi:RNA polymerase sigma-70 factor (family 1)